MEFTPRKYKTAKKGRVIKDNIVNDVVNFIRKRYDIRYNIFLNRYYISKKGSKREISKKDLLLFLRADGFKINSTILNSILESQAKEFKVSEPYNPLDNFFKSLKYNGVSHIEKLAEYIKPREFGDQPKGYYTKKFKKYFKKWFVAMVGTAMGRCANDVMFVIVQAEGGTGKTGFLEHLVGSLPEISFFKKKIKKNDYRTDMLLESTKNMLIILDELAALKPAYINEFKSDLSDIEAKIRLRYQTDEIILPRIGSFAATTNFNQEMGGFIPINDKGLLRRLFVVENTNFIKWEEYTKKIDMKQMYAEAVMLLDTDFDYTFNPEDFKYFTNFNRRYLKNIDIPQILIEHFRPGVNGNTEKLTSTEVKDILIDYNYPEAYVSPEGIGMAFNKMPDIKHNKERRNKNKYPETVYYLERK